MAFDPNSAQLAPESSGFDPTTAKPVSANPGGSLSALPSDNPGRLFGEGGRLDRLGHLIHGEFQSAVMNGFGGFIARKGYELAGVPKARVNAAVQSARDDARREIEESGSKGFNPAGLIASAVGAADPTYLINPGAGIGKALAAKGAVGAATRIGANAAAHAAMGSATDAAYQVADQLDGLQKDFDVKRNLTAAAAQGAFGGGFQGVHEVSPVVSDFVADLFKKRGIDTTPHPDPIGRNTPLTREEPSLAPDDHAELKELIRNGNEQDIRSFFNDKQGPTPTWAEVHQLVKFRDGLPENFVGQEQLRPALEGAIGDARKAAYTQHIDQETAGWKNRPDVVVGDALDEVHPEHVRKGAEDPDALGLYDAESGKVHIFTDRIDNADTLNAVLYHESLGHYGLAQQFGDRLDATLGTLLKRNVGQFGRDVDTWIKQNPGAYDGNRIRAAEEVLANMSNEGVLKKSVADAIVAQVRQFGRKMGIKLSYSDAEVRRIIQMAHQAVVSGKGRDVRGNGFRYMFTGEKANTFDQGAREAADAMLAAGKGREEVNRYTGITYADDGSPRMEISDEAAQLVRSADESAVINQPGTHMLSDILHHPRLFEAYPQLSDFKVKVEELHPGVSGGYDPETKTIHIDPGQSEDLVSTVLHEVQHAAQDIEGRPGMDAEASRAQEGMTGNEAEYLENPLEKEAFETENRRNYSAMERRNMPPNRFMRKSDIEPKDVADEAYQRLSREYVPKTRSWDEAKEMALDAGFSPAAIKDSRSVGNLDRKLFIYDQAAKEANAVLTEIAEKAKAGPLSDADQARAIESAAQFNYVLGRIENDSTQIARGLNAMKSIQFSRNNLMGLKKALEESSTNMEALADPDTMLKFLTQYAALAQNGNPNGAAQMIRSLTKPYWWQYLLTFRQNMMLSGLSTHVKAVMDMSTTTGRELQEVALAMPASAVRMGLRSLGVKNVQEGVHPTEFAARLWGLTRSALEAKTYLDTISALKNGAPQQRYANMADPRIPVVSKVTDLISAQDTFFRAFLTNQNLYALGARKAYRELKNTSHSGKVDWDRVMQEGAMHARNPTQGMLADAHEMAENTILMNRSPMNAAIDKARAIRPNMTAWEQAGSFVANMLFPFIRVSSNAIMNQFVRRSPLAFLDPVTIRAMKAGGAEADIAWAKILMGSALIGSYWMAADPKKGKLTGEGPDNFNKLKEMEASGWRAHSIHEDGRYTSNANLNLSINPFDKHNNVANMVAGMREAWEKGAKEDQVVTGVKMAFLSLMHTISDQTFVNDLAPVVDALTAKGASAGQKVNQFVGDEVRTFLPNAMQQTAKIADPIRHDTRSDSILGTAANVIQAGTPGLTGNLPVKYNVYGEPVKTGTDPLGVHNWITKGNGQQEVTDPTQMELARLGKLTPAAVVTPVQRTIKFKVDGETKSLKLTPSQESDYQKYAGQTIVQAVRDQMQSDSWNAMPDVDKIKTVRKIQTQAKKEVREALLQQEGWLNSKQLKSLENQSE